MPSSSAPTKLHRRKPSSPMPFKIRPERPEDTTAIRQVISAAFAEKSHLQHREVQVVDQLKSAGQLSVSLVATTRVEYQWNGNDAHQQDEALEGDEVVVGYVAVSPVKLVPRRDENGSKRAQKVVEGWYGLGPVAVRPNLQCNGVGKALVWKAREVLLEMNARGWVVCGRRDLYARFGFDSYAGLWVEDVPKHRVSCAELNKSEDEDQLQGEIRYCDAWRVL
ncbi:hypothetical protein CERZMDRAFT_98758 [Cercospora zeae-maydis SCOH1-5]|uniref:N-acetyltransferase domain-containing protein n=1 Tax=Cercospora zeae-maydis SCOH1-5 TaxID=717836 RepID=A0A6A6FCA5_9PEZI|nr:hypothetical protein CERZMDRAFT_98758 [Cercospora zeae-maydis SCOH1-5]